MFGILSALGAASSWTYACFLWKQQTKYFSSLEINLIKNIIAFIIFLPVIFTLDFHSNLKEIFILFGSGIIGIAIGDSFYIKSLQKLGTRMTLTVEALSPIMATILGSIILNEMPTPKVWVGVFIVSISLIGVSLQKSLDNKDKDYKNTINKGFAFAFLSVFSAVIAAILSRLVLVNSDLNPFQTTEIRLLASVLVLRPFVRVNLTKLIKELPFKNKLKLLHASFLGTNLGILLQQNVFQILPVGLGWTILSTSPAIALFFARTEGEKLTWQTFLLTASTITGVGIVFL